MEKAPERKSMRERMREHAEKTSSSGPGYIKAPEGKKITFFQPKDAEYSLDFLPYEVTVENHPKGLQPGDHWPQKSIKVHYGIGAEEKAYVCPKTIGKKCPICEDRAAMSNDPNADDKLIKDLAPKDRTLYQVIDLNEERKGVQLWDYSFHLFEKRLMSDINKTENASGGRKRSTTPHGGFSDLEGGQTLFVSFIEKKMGANKFYECDRIDAEDRDPYEEEILDEVLDLDEIVEILDYDKLKSIYLAMDEKDLRRKDSANDEPEEKPSRSRRGRSDEDDKKEDEAPSRGRRSRSEDDKKEDEEKPSRGRRGRTDDEDDKKEDEEKPSRGRRGRSNDEDDKKEDEEKPSRSRRSKSDDEDDKKEEEKPSRSRRGRSEDEEEKPEERPSRSRRGKSDDTPECLAGGVFGKDTDTHDKCYDCPDDIYAQCAALKNG